VGEKKLELNLSKVTASLSLEDAWYRVNVIEKVVFEETRTLSPPLDTLEAFLLVVMTKAFMCNMVVKGRSIHKFLTWLNHLNTI